MSTKVFQATVMSIGILFTLYFCITIIPALMQNFDVLGAFGAGFVNPYSSGYAMDAVACWGVLCVWVLYERSAYGIKHGWISLLLGVLPGVALGFALYLVMRQNQLQNRT